MSERVVFGDLVGPDRELSVEEDRWLGALASSIEATELVVSAGASRAREEPGPIVSREPTGGWRAGRYVGELRFGGRTLEIRPRLGVETLARWASAALGVRIIPMMAEHQRSAALVAELVAAAWRAALIEAARHGPPGLKTRRRHEGPYARGRLDVARTLELRAQRRPVVASVVRAKDLDNPVTRSIVLAERVLDRHISRSTWRGERLEEILPRLRAAVGSRPSPLGYRRAALLSHQIARQRGLRASASGENAEGLLIDVAELWELFVVHCARRAFGSRAVRHGARADGENLLHSQRAPGKGLGRLYPDVLVGTEGRPRAVIDAKYKLLSPTPERPSGVVREDLYQLTSYLSAHVRDPLPVGLLAYPRGKEGASARAEIDGPWRSHLGHTVRFERLPVDPEGGRQTMREVVSDVAGPGLPR